MSRLAQKPPIPMNESFDSRNPEWPLSPTHGGPYIPGSNPSGDVGPTSPEGKGSTGSNLTGGQMGNEKITMLGMWDRDQIFFKKYNLNIYIYIYLFIYIYTSLMLPIEFQGKLVTLTL